MNTLSRRPTAALAALCLAIGCALLASPALAGIHYEKESLGVYQGQLAHGEVHADGFHPGSPSGHLHVSLNDGRYMTVAYAPSEQARLVAQARGKGAHVVVATAKAHKTAAVHHKLRYIAGGILIAVILIVLVVLLIGRRRTLAGQPGGGAQASGGEAAP